MNLTDCMSRNKHFCILLHFATTINMSPEENDNNNHIEMLHTVKNSL